MFHGLYIGRLSNIQIYLDWSWAFITFFALPVMIFVVQSNIFPIWEVGMTAVLGVGMLALSLASVFVHQLAHALVANLEDIPTSRLVLYPFGGLSDIQRDPVSPETDTKIAFAGPLASAVVGSVLLLAIAILDGSTVFAVGNLQMADPIRFILWWTAALNVFLALINLLPGAPLDGGRVLRAFLWQQGSNVQFAQRLSCAIGIGLGWLTMLAAIVVLLNGNQALGTRLLIGVVLLILGGSIKSAAVRLAPEHRENPLTGVFIRDFMLSDAQPVSGNLTVQQLVTKYIFGTTNRVFVILRGDILEGMLWLEDVWKVPEEQWKRVLVKHIMTPPERLIILKPNDNAEHLLELLSQRNNRPLPVMENGRYLGVLRRRNIEEWLRAQSLQAKHSLPTQTAKRIIRYLS